MVEVRLFGNLRRHVAGATASSETVVRAPVGEGETVGGVLAHVGIDPREVGNVFLNGRLLPRSTYPILLGYQLAARQPLSPEKYWDTPVQTGDRLGVFPRNMSLVVV